MVQQAVVIVTGGAQGIGRGIVEHLAADGTRVVVADIHGKAGRALAAGLGPQALFVETDVSREDAAGACVAAALGHFGRLDALVNNAGLSNPRLAPPDELALADWQRLIDTNLTGAFLMARAAIPALRDSGGSIVNIASTRALQSEPHSEAYAAAKGGLVALTHALAVSLSGRVRVNCISPGWIDSAPLREGGRQGPPPGPDDHAQHPAGRVGSPADVAALVAYLISPAAGFMTGQNIVLDGGMTRKMIYV